MGQTNAIQNGIWVVQAGNWTRPTDFASGMSAKSDYCFIQEGSRFRDCGFICIVDGGSDTIDTHNLVWSKFASAGELLFGKGGTKTGNVLDVVSKNGAIRVNDDDIEFVFDPAFFVLDPAKGFQLKDGGVSLAKIGTDVFDGVTIAPIAAGRPFGVKNYTPIASATITRSQQFSGNVGLGTPLIIPNPFGVMSVATEIYNSGTGAKILLDVISNLTSITISANCTPAMAIRGIIQG
jgi:hypothetical protein